MNRKIIRWALVVLALGAGIGHVFYLGLHWWHGEYSLGADGLTYWKIGGDIASEWKYLAIHYSSYWPPLWPAIIGLFRFIFGPHLMPIQLLNLISLWAIALGLHYANDGWRHLSAGSLAALFALYGLEAANNVVFLQYELVSAAITVWGVLAFMRGRVGWGGVAVAATVFIQPKILVFWVILTLWCCPKKHKYAAISWVARALGLVLLLMIVWGIRNLLVFGSFQPVSFNSGINLYIGNNPLASGGYSVPVQHPDWPSVPYHESGYYIQAAFTYALTHPIHTMWLWCQKTVLFWQPTYPEDFWLLPGVLLALLLPNARHYLKVNPFIRALAVWLFCYFGVHLITFAEPRFRFGALPAIAMLAAVGWLGAYRMVKERLGH